MKIVIVGPGAMGGLFGALLVKSGEDVLLLDRRRERAASISKNGLNVEGISGELHAPVRASADPDDARNADLVIICVKSYDTKQATTRLKDVIGKNTYVLTHQNGVGNVEAISAIVGEEKTIGGVTSQGATLLGDGHIRHAGKGDTNIGSISAIRDTQYARRLEEIKKTFEKAGFETKIADNIHDLIWSKLIINVGINALTAITRLNNGRLIEFEGTDAILEEAVNEAIRVAESKGIKLIFDNPVEKVRGVCKATAGNIASMLQDVLRKRKTEIDYINGAIVAEARHFNIPVPVNRALTNLVKTLESSYEYQVTQP